jgi:hypothetical protein
LDFCARTRARPEQLLPRAARSPRTHDRRPGGHLLFPDRERGRCRLFSYGAPRLTPRSTPAPPPSAPSRVGLTASRVPRRKESAVRRTASPCAFTDLRNRLSVHPSDPTTSVGRTRRSTNARCQMLATRRFGKLRSVRVTYSESERHGHRHSPPSDCNEVVRSAWPIRSSPSCMVVLQPRNVFSGYRFAPVSPMR